MSPASAVLFAVAKELASEAKRSLPELQPGELVLNERLQNGIYIRETSCGDEHFLTEYDFRQRKSRRVAVVKEVL